MYFGHIILGLRFAYPRLLALASPRPIKAKECHNGKMGPSGVILLISGDVGEAVAEEFGAEDVAGFGVEGAAAE